MSKKPVVLMVLDGYGLNDKTEGNAIAQAKTPVMDKLMKECPFQKGNASGLSVGLPDGQMGNSEVGHMNIGAGRIIYQELTRITKAIEEGTFFENKALLAAVENAKKKNSDLHLFGLLSDGGVHSHNTHLYGLLELAKRNGLENVYVHAFLDGRDTAPTSGKGFVEELQKEMDKIGVGKIASVHGRYYAMDRDNNWDRVEKAYNALVKGEGVKADDAVKAVADSYAQDVNDEFVVPTVIEENGKPVATITIQLSSLTSDLTVPVRLHALSVMKVLTSLREQTDLCLLHLYALQIMMRLSETNLLHLRRRVLKTHLVSSLQHMI